MASGEILALCSFAHFSGWTEPIVPNSDCVYDKLLLAILHRVAVLHCAAIVALLLQNTWPGTVPAHSPKYLWCYALPLWRKPYIM